MKKLLLSILTILVSSSFYAQSCSPNPLYADSTYGVWPDTTVNLPPALQNVFYSTNLDFAIPSTVTPNLVSGNPLGSLLVGNTINYFKVDSVSGLTPANLQFVCSSSNCQYQGGSHGCANLYGTPQNTGTYPLKIHITANISTVLGQSNIPTSFDGYKVVVGVAGKIEQYISPITVVPNPANEIITIEGLTSTANTTVISIINIEGKTIARKDIITNEKISFDLSETSSGIYFVKLAHENGSETIRFIKN